MNNEIASLENVSLRYGNVAALENISFRLRPLDFVSTPIQFFLYF